MSGPTSRTKRQPEYSNMTPRLPGHFSIYDWFPLCSSLVWELRDRVVNLQASPLSLGVMLEFKYIERGPIKEDVL